MLDVSSLGKTFGGVTALRDISFTVEQGDIVGIMGANGAGKTTLFSIIAGNTRASTGTIRFDGRTITGLKPHRISQAGIARTFQIVRPLRGLSVRENVKTSLQFGARRLGQSAAQAETGTILETTGLAAAAGQLAGSLTLAQQKRLEVARALAGGPRIILLDEVMAGLTPTEVLEMIDLVQRIRSDMTITVLIIEHVMGALMKLSDRIIVLHHGEMIAEGTPAAVAGDPAVQDAYLGAVA